MKGKTWERTSVAGLLRNRSGRYYGTLSVAGKDKFVSMKTTLLEVARKKFSEGEGQTRARPEGSPEIRQRCRDYGRLSDRVSREHC